MDLYSVYNLAHCGNFTGQFVIWLKSENQGSEVVLFRIMAKFFIGLMKIFFFFRENCCY